MSETRTPYLDAPHTLPTVCPTCGASLSYTAAVIDVLEGEIILSDITVCCPVESSHNRRVTIGARTGIRAERARP